MADPTPTLTDAEARAVDVCPDCGAHASKHSDLGRTITPSVCARTVPGARAAAVAHLLAAARADERKRWEPILRKGIAAETEPCRLDHNGDCQEHGWFDGECWVSKVRAALAQPADTEATGSER